ncbi:MAG TPA: hypothetical protein VLB69_10960 [Rudaea sp.]|nr:hypothetical protein [Rudaea sp.]
MWPVAHTLTDKQIDALAKHFAAQKPELQPVEGKPEQIDLTPENITNVAAYFQALPHESGH